MDTQLKSRLNKVTALPRRMGRLFRRWSMGPDAASQIERWQTLDQTGADLEAIMASPAWASLEAAKRFYQDRAEQTVRMPSMSEDARLRAAIELATLDGFFRELRNRVRTGQQARTALSKVQDHPMP